MLHTFMCGRQLVYFKNFHLNPLTYLLLLLCGDQVTCDSWGQVVSRHLKISQEPPDLQRI